MSVQKKLLTGAFVASLLLGAGVVTAQITGARP